MGETPHSDHTVFLLGLSAMKDNQILPAYESADAPLQSQENPHHCILALEKDIFVRQFNTVVLLRSGYEADTAAWEALGAEDTILMIIDHSMPKVSCAELLKKLLFQSRDLICFQGGHL